MRLVEKRTEVEHTFAPLHNSIRFSKITSNFVFAFFSLSISSILFIIFQGWDTLGWDTLGWDTLGWDILGWADLSEICRVFLQISWGAKRPGR